MLLDMIRSDVPVTFFAGERLGETGGTVKWSAMEELFQTMAIFQVQFNCVVGQDSSLVAAFLTGFVIELLNQGSEMIMQPLGQHARAGTKRASHIKLIDNSFANEGALVGQLVQDISELGLYLKGDDCRFSVLLGHDVLWRLLCIHFSFSGIAKQCAYFSVAACF